MSYIIRKLKEEGQEVHLYEWNSERNWFEPWELRYEKLNLVEGRKASEDYPKFWEDLPKIAVILFDGYELALARGGPHCMTLPILRE